MLLNTTKIKNIFSLKCPTPKLLKTSVVYKFDCLCDLIFLYWKNQKTLSYKDLAA